MEFSIDTKQNMNKDNYQQHDRQYAIDFSTHIVKEFKDFIKGVVLFGSTARKQDKTHDIDLLVVVDDIHVTITPELTEAFKIITEKIIQQVSDKLHITTLKYTTFWDYARAGDPVVINILRDGYPILDTGFFEPLQRLLFQGRIRPSIESVQTYYLRAPRSLEQSKVRLLDATIDLYWAVVDSAHAALMRHGQIPPTPEHVADLLEKVLVKRKLCKPHHATIMRRFYHVMKMITHKEINQIKGQEYDHYLKDAQEFVDAMKEAIESNPA